MAMQNFTMTPARLGKYKGQILAHAVPAEVLGRTGRQIKFPKNNSDTYVARKWLPYGATATNASTMNALFQNGTGDRGNAIVQAHQVQEGVISTAQLTGLPIVPASYHLNWKIRLKSWDRFQVPLPFSRCEVSIGRIMRVPRETTD